MDLLVEKLRNLAPDVHFVQIQGVDLPLDLVLHALEVLFQLVSFDIFDKRVAVATIVLLRVHIVEIGTLGHVVATPTILVCTFLYREVQTRNKQNAQPNRNELPLRCSLGLDTFYAVGRIPLSQNGRSLYNTLLQNDHSKVAFHSTKLPC